MDVQAHIEEMEDSSSQETVAPSTITSIITKKKGASRKGDGAPAPSNNTLTSFLASGSHSRSIWEDMNRQCPVCQKSGFSTGQALSLHVNSCLDTKVVFRGREGDEREVDGRTKRGEGAEPQGKLTGGMEADGGRNRPSETGPLPAARKPSRKHGTGGGAPGCKRDGASSSRHTSIDKKNGRTTNVAAGVNIKATRERECETARSNGTGAGKQGKDGKSKASCAVRSGK